MTEQPETALPAMIESAEDFFAKAGPLPSAYDEARRFPRFYYRSCAEATIYALRGDAKADRVRCTVVTRDLSRGGMGILCPQELFPGQRLDIVLNGDQQRTLEVMWCRRLADRSYACGCKFVAKAAAEPGE
jgi:hypothetical protein